MRQAAVGRGEQPQEPPPPPDTIYCLLMHLPPATIEGRLVEQLPWLGRVDVPLTSDEEDAVEIQEREARQQVDRDTESGDRDYRLQAGVGNDREHAHPANYTADIRWVQGRLTAHNQVLQFLEAGSAQPVGPPGAPSEELKAAIQAFQRAVVRLGQGKFREAATRQASYLRPRARGQAIDGRVSVPTSYSDHPARGHTVPGTYYALAMEPPRA